MRISDWSSDVCSSDLSAATGGQDILSSRAENKERSTKNSIERVVRGVGGGWVRSINRTYDLKKMRDALREAMTTKETGPKVIIAQSECMLNKQRREQPLVRQPVKLGRASGRERGRQYGSITGAAGSVQQKK